MLSMASNQQLSTKSKFEKVEEVLNHNVPKVGPIIQMYVCQTVDSNTYTYVC